MKKIIVFLLLPVWALTGCLETEQATTINADGSGSYETTIDMGTLMQLYTMSLSMKSQEERPGKTALPLVRDTLIYFRHYTDTAAAFSEKEKELLRNTTLSVKINSEENIFRVKVNNTFKQLNDMEQVIKLMGRREFDNIFDNAMKLPGLTDEKDSAEAVPGKTGEDNIFDLIAPDFFNCKYQPGNIVCVLNPAKHQTVLRKLKQAGMGITEKQNREMMSGMKFSNRYVLPNKAKLVTGLSMKKAGATELVQTGTFYDLYKNPKKYEYTIKY